MSWSGIVLIGLLAGVGFTMSIFIAMLAFDNETLLGAAKLGVLAIAFGFWLWFGYGFSGGWLHAKTALVAILAIYHWHCGRLLKQFQLDGNSKSHVWFRFYNELPVIVLLLVLFLVVLKPF